MANSARLKFNLDDLRQTIKLYGARVTRDALREVQATVERAAARTGAAAPEDTGALKGSIKASVRTDGYTIRGTVRVGVPYAAHVEFGTEHVNKQPHLVPASVSERKTMQARLARVIVEAAPRDLGTPAIVGNESPLPEIEID